MKSRVPIEQIIGILKHAESVIKVKNLIREHWISEQTCFCLGIKRCIGRIQAKGK